MKKILAFLLLFTFSIALVLIFFAKNPLTPIRETVRTIQKEIDKKNKASLTKISIEPKAEVTNHIESNQIEKKEPLKFKDRFVEGNMPKNLENLEFINQVNPNWKVNLAKNLVHFLPIETKVSITHEKEVIRFFGEKSAQYAEVVLIKMQLPSQKNSSYHALIDSSSSKVLSTWDFDRIEL
ncbi:MAG: hypothetical protein U0T83_11535 [Bacteriovoracaceae bacterium]